MCKEGWCVGLRKKGAAWGWGEVSEYLGGIEKMRGETKILEREGERGQAGSSEGALKSGGRGVAGVFLQICHYIIKLICKN